MSFHYFGIDSIDHEVLFQDLLRLHIRFRDFQGQELQFNPDWVFFDVVTDQYYQRKIINFILGKTEKNNAELCGKRRLLEPVCYTSIKVLKETDRRIVG